MNCDRCNIRKSEYICKECLNNINLCGSCNDYIHSDKSYVNHTVENVKDNNNNNNYNLSEENIYSSTTMLNTNNDNKYDYIRSYTERVINNAKNNEIKDLSDKDSVTTLNKNNSIYYSSLAKKFNHLLQKKNESKLNINDSSSYKRYVTNNVTNNDTNNYNYDDNYSNNNNNNNNTNNTNTHNKFKCLETPINYKNLYSERIDTLSEYHKNNTELKENKPQDTENYYINSEANNNSTIYNNNLEFYIINLKNIYNNEIESLKQRIEFLSKTIEDNRIKYEETIISLENALSQEKERYRHDYNQMLMEQEEKQMKAQDEFTLKIKYLENTINNLEIKSRDWSKINKELEYSNKAIELKLNETERDLNFKYNNKSNEYNKLRDIYEERLINLEDKYNKEKSALITMNEKVLNK